MFCFQELLFLSLSLPFFSLYLPVVSFLALCLGLDYDSVSSPCASDGFSLMAPTAVRPGVGANFPYRFTECSRNEWAAIAEENALACLENGTEWGAGLMDLVRFGLLFIGI